MVCVFETLKWVVVIFTWTYVKILMDLSLYDYFQIKPKVSLLSFVLTAAKRNKIQHGAKFKPEQPQTTEQTINTGNKVYL